ncbi:hypothetical protein [Hoyosella altamirensis]|uniref:Uncharacterized protein (DUF3084 family) n=1 Tax=Hoyosella altamirensis TaxID=616997 RepID=A0A839RNQ3_9ACTN|nr:hypothetical protein [Hoyosella altamirensis]MBB3038130.1 uncharacterized protein (DUF3084 family) [Hoyosella altamirensis]
MSDQNKGQPGDITGGDPVHTTPEEATEEEEAQRVDKEDSTSSSSSKAAGAVPDTSELDPEVVRKAEEEVAGINKKYKPGARPTVRVPDTGGTVTGTAFAEDFADHEENKDIIEDYEERREAETEE